MLWHPPRGYELFDERSVIESGSIPRVGARRGEGNRIIPKGEAGADVMRAWEQSKGTGPSVAHAQTRALVRGAGAGGDARR